MGDSRLSLKRALVALVGCAATASASCGSPPPPVPRPAPQVVVDVEAEKLLVAAELDDFHAAATRADEERYFGHFAPDGVFLGTDAHERWTVEAFRAYAHPHFAKGKAWSFTSIRRDVRVDAGGAIAWFDEDLATPNLGPARGSGVMIKRNGRWWVEEYNLAVTVPNERFDDVKRAIEGDGPCPSGEGTLHAVVTLRGAPPSDPEPREHRQDAFCSKLAWTSSAVAVRNERLADVVVRLPPGAVRDTTKPRSAPIAIDAHACTYAPRTSAARVGETVAFTNSQGHTTVTLHAFSNGRDWFTQFQPFGRGAISRVLEAPGVVAFQSEGQPWMRGFILVTDHHYFSTSDADGEARIEHVPAGRYTVEAWHAVFGFARDTIDVTNGKTTEVTFAFDATKPHAAEEMGLKRLEK